MMHGRLAISGRPARVERSSYLRQEGDDDAGVIDSVRRATARRTKLRRRVRAHYPSNVIVTLLLPPAGAAASSAPQGVVRILDMWGP